MAGAVENDGIIMAVASPHGGVCLRSDLIAAGLSPHVIDSRVRSGLLRVVGRGLYVVNELAGAATDLWLAVLAAPGAVLSHLTAALLHNLAIDRSVRCHETHIWVPAAVRRRTEGVVVHRTSRPLSEHDIVLIDRLPVTSPARTIVDLAAVVGEARLRHVVQTALRDGLIDELTLVACFESTARQGVAGSAKMRRLLRSMFHNDSVAESVLEQAVAELFTTHGIEGFVAQVRPPWYDGFEGIVDFAHPELGIVLEADGRRWHRRDQEMTADRRRDRLAAAHGWVPLRVTWEEVTRRPGAIAEDVLAVMAARHSRAA